MANRSPDIPDSSALTTEDSADAEMTSGEVPSVAFAGSADGLSVLGPRLRRRRPSERLSDGLCRGSASPCPSESSELAASVVAASLPVRVSTSAVNSSVPSDPLSAVPYEATSPAPRRLPPRRPRLRRFFGSPSLLSSPFFSVDAGVSATTTVSAAAVSASACLAGRLR